MFEQNYVYINKCAYPPMNYKLLGIIRNASSLSMYTALTLFLGSLLFVGSYDLHKF
jgi:hypothetical protein